MEKLVKLLKQMSSDTINNSEPFEYRKGKVETITPLTVRIDQKILLEEDELILTHLVKDYEVDISVSHETKDFELIEGAPTDIKKHKHEYKGRKKIKIHQGLKVGEEVILLKVQGGQNYIVLDRYTEPMTEGEWL
ncbi:DUF2577 domain-containing protein [Leptotrichia shahii]|uniref:DUF2577 domain-containing protein n=1 Tax=Leptotrichia shahii TaxID=157691 RepID=UPI0028D18C29|nr:DUF2577 domain-containing protein [Leptotrichia shahii]